MSVRVEIAGEYGVGDGSIHIFKDGHEVVMWDSREWCEDPSLVYVIANAIRMAYEGKLPESADGGIGLWSPAVSEAQQDWTVYDDIQDSYALAMRSAGISEDVIAEVNGTVTDYVANNYGDD